MKFKFSCIEILSDNPLTKSNKVSNSLIPVFPISLVDKNDFKKIILSAVVPVKLKSG